MKFFAIVLVSTILASTTAEDLKSAKVEVKVVENLSEFRIANPELKLTELKRLSSKKISPRLTQIIYSLGSPTSGDRLVAADSGWAAYPVKQNVELTISYPVGGNGALITFVQVVINQDTGTDGRAYVAYGGIGHRAIQLVIEAWNTAYLDYSFRIFGL